jgi:hypothetical protein
LYFCFLYRLRKNKEKNKEIKELEKDWHYFLEKAIDSKNPSFTSISNLIEVGYCSWQVNSPY